MLIPAEKCCKVLPQNKEDYGCIVADKICIRQEIKKLT